MDVTPVTLRDVSVSSGVGAEPHGRETSHPTTEDKTNETSSEVKFEKPEYPIDPRADALAARLQMADPQMDDKTAKKIAKQLLTPAARWELKTNQPEAPASHVDTQA